MSAAEVSPETQPEGSLAFPYSFVAEMGPEFRPILVGILKGRSQADIAHEQECAPEDIKRAFQEICTGLGLDNTDRYEAISTLLVHKSTKNFDEMQLNGLDDTERRVFKELTTSSDLAQVRDKLGLSQPYFYAKSRSVYDKLGIKNRYEFWGTLHGAPKFIADLEALEELGLLERVNYSDKTLSEELVSPTNNAQEATGHIDAHALYKGLRSFVHNLLIDARQQLGELEMLDPEVSFEVSLNDEEIDHLIELRIIPKSTRDTRFFNVAGFAAAKVLENEDYRFSLYNPFTQQNAAKIISYITHDAKRDVKSLK